MTGSIALNVTKDQEVRVVILVSLHHDVSIMMRRTQLSFDPRMLRGARSRASELGVSLAEYVRRLVAEDLGGHTPSADPGIVFDLGASHGSDVSASKDAMLGAAFADAER
jgi:hypothetical protein